MCVAIARYAWRRVACQGPGAPEAVDVCLACVRAWLWVDYSTQAGHAIGIGRIAEWWHVCMHDLCLIVGGGCSVGDCPPRRKRGHSAAINDNTGQTHRAGEAPEQVKQSWGTSPLRAQVCVFWGWTARRRQRRRRGRERYIYCAHTARSVPHLRRTCARAQGGRARCCDFF